MGYHIDKEACIACGSCDYTCPSGAIRLDSGPTSFFYYIEKDYCIECGVCLDTCPIDAIEYEETPGLLSRIKNSFHGEQKNS